MTENRLPIGSEFSPSTIDLATVLKLAATHAGNPSALETAFHHTYFMGKDRRMPNNLKNSMFSYGVIDDLGNLTAVGQKLLAKINNPPAMYEALATHILRNLNGITLIDTVLRMQDAGEQTKQEIIREWLIEGGLTVPEGKKDISMMKLWLQKAGVVGTGRRDWRIDEVVYANLAGLSITDIAVLMAMPREQRYFLKTLANTVVPASHLASSIRDAAQRIYGVQMPQKRFKAAVLDPLAANGYITIRSRGTGKSPEITPTSKLIKDVIDPILDQLDQLIRPELRPIVRMPLSTIVANTKDKTLSNNDRGLALEALTIRLMRLVDLTYVGTRVREMENAGGEVDAIFESDRLVFSRWQVQCKNTSSVNLRHVSSEVGLAPVYQSNVVMVVTTGTISADARSYATDIMKRTHLAIVLLDGQDLDQIIIDPPSIIDVLDREARKAMRTKHVKPSDLKGTP